MKEKIEPGVPFMLMGKKIFDCHHGKDRSVAMKKRAEQKRVEVENLASELEIFGDLYNFMCIFR